MDPRLLFVFSRGWADRERRVAAGEAPAESHGVFAVRRRGLDADAVDASIVARAPTALGVALEWLYVIPRSQLGYRLHQALAVRRHVADDPGRWIVPTSDSLGLPLLRLKAAGRLDNPVACLSIGLADRVASGTLARPLARRYRGLLAAADALLVFTDRERELLAGWAPAARVAVIPFGVDAGWWAPPAGGGPNGGAPVVFAGGRDPARDFPTLARAVEGLPVRTVIAGRLAAQQGVAERPGLELRGEVSELEYRRLTWSSTLVVVPSRAAVYGAGQTAALHAMAAGRPVVMAESGWAARGGLEPGRHFVEVAPGDPAALRTAIGELVERPDRGAALGAAAQAVVRERFSADAQARALLAAIERSGRG